MDCYDKLLASIFLAKRMSGTSDHQKKKLRKKNGITRPRPDGRVITSVYFRMLFPTYLNASMVSWS